MSQSGNLTIGNVTINNTPSASTDGVHVSYYQSNHGPQGASGAQGTNGTTGTTGANGSQGLTGANGVQGTNGTAGAQGATGVQGILGFASFLAFPCTSQLNKTNDTGLANIPGLSAQLGSGITYTFEVALNISAGASGGIQVDLNGGTCTATAVNWTLVFHGPTIGAAAVISSLSTATGSTSAVVQAFIYGSITVSSGGTFIPRFAQNVSNGTASSVLIGSFMTIM